SWAGSSTLSMTVMSSSRLKNWKIMPTWLRRNRATPVSLSLSTRWPPTTISPLVGRSRPAMRFSSVDFPLPDGPMIATASPGVTVRLTSDTAGAAPLSYDFVTWSRCTSASMRRRYVAAAPHHIGRTTEPGYRIWLTLIPGMYGTSHQAPPMVFATAIFAVFSAVLYSAHRELALGVALAGAIAVMATFPENLPDIPERYTALIVVVPTVAAGLGIRELRRRVGDSTARLRKVQAEHEAATRR